MTRLVIAVLALLALAPAAARADTVVADPAAQQVAALNGTIVWVSGDSPQTLMQHDASGDRPVQGAPAAPYYRSIDLGLDRDGRLVLTYQRCSSPSRCAVRQDDLHGHRTSMSVRLPSGCTMSVAPARWQTRTAYGVGCRTSSRSGLYVKTGSAPARRLPRPHDAARFGVTQPTSVDLRGTRVAAVLSDIYSYAFAENTDRSALRAHLSAASEGDSDAHTPGLALGTGGTLWSLTDAEHAGDPLQTVIQQQTATCDAYQTITAPEGDERYPATDLAADGEQLYLVVPGTGIATHAFAPIRSC
jgi:hypothetical protein